MKDLSEIERPPELSDGRLRLRALRPDDKPAVVAGLNDEQCGRFLWLPPFPYTDGDFDEFYASRADAWPEKREAFWVIASADDEVLGAISLDVDPLFEAGDIGYWCGPWARRRGVMTAAVRLVRDWGFDGLGIERIEITPYVDNVASQRTALAAGFTREGVMRGGPARTGRRDMVVFGMLPSDPRPAPGERRPGDLGWPLLEDGVLAVRPFEPDDAPAVQAACDDPDVAHWIFQVPAPYTLADAEDFIAGSRRRLVAGERARLAVCDCASGELLGSISLDLFRDGDAAEIGYWVAREARRRGVALGGGSGGAWAAPARGVALAAARLIIRWAFEDVGVERLEILTYPGNTASQSLAGKLGFAREAVLRGFLPCEPGKSREGRFVPPDGGSPPARDDQIQFVLLREDWAG